MIKFFRRIRQNLLTENKFSKEAYWKKNLKLLGILLLIWFTVSLGFGILLVDQLNAIKIGGFKLGFWFAQQGAIYIFVLLIFIYILLMNRLDLSALYQRIDNIKSPYWLSSRNLHIFPKPAVS